MITPSHDRDLSVKKPYIYCTAVYMLYHRLTWHMHQVTVLKINNNKMYTTIYFNKNWGNTELENGDKNLYKSIYFVMICI